MNRLHLTNLEGSQEPYMQDAYNAVKPLYWYCMETPDVVWRQRPSEVKYLRRLAMAGFFGMGETPIAERTALTDLFSSQYGLDFSELLALDGLKVCSAAKPRDGYAIGVDYQVVRDGKPASFLQLDVNGTHYFANAQGVHPASPLVGEANLALVPGFEAAMREDLNKLSTVA